MSRLQRNAEGMAESMGRNIGILETFNLTDLKGPSEKKGK
jgi:hypothetical protein